MRFRYSYRKKAKLFANSEDPDQTPHSAVSDLGLHCLPITRLGVSQLQWVKYHSSMADNVLKDVWHVFSFYIFSREKMAWHFMGMRKWSAWQTVNVEYQDFFSNKQTIYMKYRDFFSKKIKQIILDCPYATVVIVT